VGAQLRAPIVGAIPAAHKGQSSEQVGKLTRLHYGAVTAREPREQDAQEVCRRLGKRLAERVAVYVGGRPDQHPLVKPDVRLAPGQA
jgi:NAD(P)H dehydrogenase (quinone)